MGRKALPRGQALRRLPVCGDCGGRIRNPRTTKSCPRCGVVLPIASFGHSRSRPDHRDTWCRSCRREIRAKPKATGDPMAWTDISPLADGWVVGVLASQSPIDYVTEDGKQVCGLLLTGVLTSEGERFPALRLAHPYRELLREPALFPGARIVAVVQSGMVVKLLAVDDQAKDVTTCVDEFLAPHRPPQAEDGTWHLTTYPPARPWLLPAAQRFAGVEPVEDPRMGADVFLMERGVPADEVYDVLDTLEDAYLLSNLEPPVRIEGGNRRWKPKTA